MSTRIKVLRRTLEETVLRSKVRDFLFTLDSMTGEFWDDISGAILDPEKLREARKEEMREA